MVGRIVVALALTLSLGVAAGAQTPDPGDPTSATPATLHGALRISLEDALAMGLKNNLDVEVSRHDPLASWEEFRSAWGAYDPLLFAEFGYESAETPVASSLQASSALIEREVGGQGGVRGKVPWLNATYGFGYDGSSVETTSSIAGLSPEYRAAISAEASVPLLKNLIWDRDWTRVKQSEVLYNISNEDFRRQVMDTVRNIENAYWNLVATDDAVRVAEKSQETAEALLRQTKTQYEVGVVSRVEVTEAEAGLAEREVNLIRTRNRYQRAQDVLMNEVLGRGLRPGSRMEIEPSTRPDDYIVYQIDVEEATHKAFENRPELAQAYDEIERRKLELSYRKNQKLPQLDLKLRYWLQGLSGKTNSAPSLFGGPRAPALVDPNYRNAHDDYFNKNRADSWSAMGVFSIPIGNRAAGHQANKAEIELRKAASQVARLRQGIILEVRDAARNLEAAQEGIEAAERQRIATEEQLRAERIRLEQGESTPFDVLLRERDLVDAEVNKIDALRVYRNSVTDLDRRQGTILRTRNILIDDVRATP